MLLLENSVITKDEIQPRTTITMRGKSNLEILKEVKTELNRFTERLDLAIEEQSKPKGFSLKRYAAAKRAALDLKNELTKLTQDSKYKYS